jgi:hypothetical protein
VLLLCHVWLLLRPLLRIQLVMHAWLLQSLLKHDGIMLLLLMHRLLKRYWLRQPAGVLVLRLMVRMGRVVRLEPRGPVSQACLLLVRMLMCRLLLVRHQGC